MWWILGVIIIVFIIYLINKDYKKEVKTKVTNLGGMQQKYKIIIDYFINNLPARITKLTNDSVIISASATTVYLDYVGSNLEVELKGVTPIGNYSKKWKYPSGYPQDKMIVEIQNYCEWQANRIIKGMSQNNNKINNELVFRDIVKEEFSSAFEEFKNDAMGDIIKTERLFRNTIDNIKLKAHLMGVNISSERAQSIINEISEQLEEEETYSEIITLEAFLKAKDISANALEVKEVANGSFVLAAHGNPVATIKKEIQGVTVEETFKNIQGIQMCFGMPHANAVGTNGKPSLPCLMESKSQWDVASLGF